MNIIQSMRSIYDHSFKINPHQKQSNQLFDLIQLENKENLKNFLSTVDANLLNERMTNGELPLVFLVKKRKWDLIPVLINAGANLSQRDDQKLSAIDYALLANDSETLACLMQTFIYQDTEHAQILLGNASANNKINFYMDKIGSKVNKRISHGTPALHEAILKCDKTFVKNSIKENFDEFTQEHESVLHYAALIDDIEIVSLCLEHSKKHINKPNKDGLTPLHYAAAAGNLEIVKLLCQNGAKMDVMADGGITPLALMGAVARMRNPLKVHWMDDVILLSSLAMWTASFIPDNASVSLKMTKALMNSKVFAEGLSYAYFFNSFDSWKGTCAVVALEAFLKYAPLPPQLEILRTAYSLYRITWIGWSALDNLKSAWRNSSLNYWDAFHKAVVQIPAAFSIKNWMRSLYSEPKETEPKKSRCIQLADEQCEKLSNTAMSLCKVDEKSTQCVEAQHKYDNYLNKITLYREGDCKNSLVKNVKKCTQLQNEFISLFDKEKNLTDIPDKNRYQYVIKSYEDYLEGKRGGNCSEAMDTLSCRIAESRADIACSKEPGTLNCTNQEEIYESTLNNKTSALCLPNTPHLFFCEELMEEKETQCQNPQAVNSRECKIAERELTRFLAGKITPETKFNDRIEKARKILFTCDAVKEMVTGFEQKMRFTVKMVPSEMKTRVRTGYADLETGDIYLSADIPMKQFLRTYLFEVQNLENSWEFHTVSAPCKKTADEYGKEMETIEYKSYFNYYNLLKKCAEASPNGPLAPGRFYSLEETLEQMDKNGHTEIYRQEWYTKCAQSQPDTVDFGKSPIL